MYMKKVAHPEIVLKLRNEGKSAREIGKILGCNGNNINKVLRQNFGIQTVNPYRYNRKFEVNNEFLDTINNEIQSYFIGLLWADGHIDKTKDIISIALAKKDSKVLQSLSDKIQPNKSLCLIKSKNPNHQDIVRLDIFSSKIKEKLIEMGCKHNKTYDLDWPIFNFDKINLPHFIRGYLDGDGCVFVPKDYKRICINIIGHEKFINQLKVVLEQVLNIHCCIYKPKNCNQCISSLYIYGGKQAETFCSFVYQDATIFLQRKYDKYLLIKNRPNKRNG